MALQVLDRCQEPRRVISEHAKARIALSAKDIANHPGGVAVVDGQAFNGTAYGAIGSELVDVRVSESVPISAVDGERASGLAVRTAIIDVVEIFNRPELFTPWASPADLAARFTCQLPAAREKSDSASNADALSPLGIRHTRFAFGGRPILSSVGTSDVIKLFECLSLLALGALLGWCHKRNLNSQDQES